MPETALTLIRIAHSPDPDDAFMHYALAEHKLDAGNFRFEHHLGDIESLNRRALQGEFEVTAVSIHAFAYLTGSYMLLNHGASMGEGYGPRIVARKTMPVTRLARGRGLRMAIPGEWTSAHLAAQLMIGAYDFEVVPFDRILEAVARGEFDAGLVIHEGQLTYTDMGLELVADLGSWWASETGGLPLPLGGNAIRRDLGAQIPSVSRLLKESIEYALTPRQEALAYAAGFGRGLDPGRNDTFVGMYVNDRTLDYGDDGREAVRLFLERAHGAGLLPEPPALEFVP
ncbi:MAG: MqnA/MqnD/SBP family protein [Planctomycetota bacterium]